MAGSCTTAWVESALARFQRDALDQPGVSSVIVLIGINDISWPGTAFARKQARPTLAELQAGYRALAEQAHRRGLRILGATLMPFAGALPGTPLDDYYHPDKDALRRQLNAWLRTDRPVRRGDRPGRGPARSGRSVTDGRRLRLRRSPASG
ncbi:MAG: GDSL-type esterase/lipase family protein [Stenotrophomonas maltophilia]